MAKARIGHDEEARVLEALGVDMVDESEVLTPADPFYHIAKNEFTIPFVCGCTNLGEAVRRVVEGAAMIRTKGEAGTGNVVAAVQHARVVAAEIDLVQRSTSQEFETIAATISNGFRRLEAASEHTLNIVDTPFGSLNDVHTSVLEVLGEVREMGRLPVVTFSAGGIATPADAALLMRHRMDGVFVGSGIFKSENPVTTAEAIVMATHHFEDAAKIAEASAMMAGRAMDGLEIDTLDVRMDQRGL
jgi:pyridoxal 5'-phosphate synthase pdxS subunit